MTEASVQDLFNEFLRHRTYQKDFCLKLIDLAKQSTVSWPLRRLATLMAEHQILKLRADDLENFDVLLTRLNLKQPGRARSVIPNVLKEGYSTTELAGFIVELQRKLARLNRVHQKVNGKKTTEAVRQEFLETSSRDCKLTLARYLFTPDEVVNQVLAQVKVSEGVKDVDVSQPRYVNTEISHALSRLPAYEARILQRLCESTKVYWVGETTSSSINSLVEYPLTTVVLVIKPPGSHFEFELKRAGRRGNPLSVVFTRNGNRVPGSHRLDGGSMQWLLRYEARNGSKLSFIYRLVHGTESPMPGYISRNTVFTVSVHGHQAPAFRYFTDPRVFGNAGFREMRAAMKAALEVLKNEEGENLPELPGEMALTAEFLSHVAPAQTILSGTSSFRLDKLATYLSANGAETYFKQYLGRDYTDQDAKQFADELLDEVLGVYDAPDAPYRDFESYLEAALSVPKNRKRADETFLTLIREIAIFWGTLLGVRGHSRGESFVARNVGLRTVWEQGQWQVKLIFMDHDGLSLPELEHGHFFAQNALPGIMLDERHAWGRANPALFPGTLAGCLQRIYRISERLETKARSLVEIELNAAYLKTQQALSTNTKLRAFFGDVFLSRLFDWDQFVAGYLAGQDKRWKSKMKKLFAAKGYESDTFEYYLKAVEKHKGFIERNAFLFARNLKVS